MLAKLIGPALEYAGKVWNAPEFEAAHQGHKTELEFAWKNQHLYLFGTCRTCGTGRAGKLYLPTDQLEKLFNLDTSC